jgi:hypothetical protein
LRRLRKRQTRIKREGGRERERRHRLIDWLIGIDWVRKTAFVCLHTYLRTYLCLSVCLSVCLMACSQGLPDFFGPNTPKWEKYTKWPQTIPNSHKLCQMAVKYSKRS